MSWWRKFVRDSRCDFPKSPSLIFVKFCPDGWSASELNVIINRWQANVNVPGDLFRELPQSWTNSSEDTVEWWWFRITLYTAVIKLEVSFQNPASHSGAKTTNVTGKHDDNQTTSLFLSYSHIAFLFGDGRHPVGVRFVHENITDILSTENLLYWVKLSNLCRTKWLNWKTLSNYFIDIGGISLSCHIIAHCSLGDSTSSRRLFHQLPVLNSFFSHLVFVTFG